MNTVWNLLDRKQRLYICRGLASWLVLLFLYSTFWWAIPFSYGELLTVWSLGVLIYGHIYLGE